MFLSEDARRRIARRTLLAFAGTAATIDGSAGAGGTGSPGGGDDALGQIGVGAPNGHSHDIADTFQNGVVEMTWQAVAGTWTESSGVLTPSTGTACLLYAGMSFPMPSASILNHAEVRIGANVANRQQCLGMTATADLVGFCAGVYIQTAAASISLLQIQYDEGSLLITTLFTVAVVPTENMLLELERDAFGEIYVYADDVLLGSIDGTLASFGPIKFVLASLGTVAAAFNSFAAWQQQ